MSAQTAAVVASALAAVAALGAVVTCVVLSRRTAQLRRLVAELQSEAVPLVRQARVVVDQAASEMERVGDVLGSAEAVTATVDSASRLAYRAFANPVVGVMAFGTGVVGAIRRFFGRTPRRRRLPEAAGARPEAPASSRHRRQRRAARRTTAPPR